MPTDDLQLEHARLPQIFLSARKKILTSYPAVSGVLALLACQQSAQEQVSKYYVVGSTVSAAPSVLASLSKTTAWLQQCSGQDWIQSHHPTTRHEVWYAECCTCRTNAPALTNSLERSINPCACNILSPSPTFSVLPCVQCMCVTSSYDLPHQVSGESSTPTFLVSHCLSLSTGCPDHLPSKLLVDWPLWER